MTGIERLRRLARSQNMDNAWTAMLAHELCDIADQIERERECERDTIENLRLELGEARDAAAWVREHGGLESVKERLDWVVGHCSTKQQLDFDFWLSGRVMHELGFDEDMADRDEVERRLLARLMPEGMEWPRYEDGEPVRIWDKIEDIEVRSIVFNEGGILLSDCTSVPGWGTWRSYKERVKRTAVPAADGEPLEAGQTVWKLYPHVERVVVKDIYRAGGTTVVEYQSDGVSYPEHCHPSDLTHTKPERDSWERVEEDARGLDSGVDRELFTHTHEDLVRRCRALAERGQ